MTLSLNILKQYLNLNDIDVSALAEQLTEGSCEIEKIIYHNQHLNNIVTVKVTHIEPHPDSDHLNLVSFTTGKEELRVVCGAPNVIIGMITAFAPIGTTFPDGFTLTPKKIRGILSDGMLCSEKELGLGDNHDGIMNLPADTVLGQSIASLFNLPSDVLFEIDNKSITNRSDLWGFLGMARETAALLGQDFKFPYDETWKKDMLAKIQQESTPPVTVTVDKNSNCLGYYGLSVSGVEEKESPLWLQQALNACGMRPINALVDISNYVMLELGIPTHFFDRDLITSGHIQVRKLSADHTFITLDGKERALTAGDNVVCDEQDPLVLAGIMGGENSMVSQATKNLFIEIAVWQAEEVRKTSLRIGLRTESSVRYEKSLDPQLIEQSLLRCVDLISQVFPRAEFIGSIEKAGLTSFTPYTVDVDINRFNKVMGLSITVLEAQDILLRLGFGVEIHQTTLTVMPPSWRSTKDHMAQADIFEEIGRVYGYSKIIPEAPVWPLNPSLMPQRLAFERKIQDFFVLRGGALEIFTHPMVGESFLKKALWPELAENLKVANSVSPEHDRMRPSLIPSFLDMAETNQKNFDSFTCFEFGRAFSYSQTSFSSDRYRLALACFSRKESRFLEAVNLIEELFNALHLKGKVIISEKTSALVSENWHGFHPRELASVSIEGKKAGFMTTVHPYLLKNYKIKGQLTLVEIDFTDFMDKKQIVQFNYKPLPKYPFSTFDCTVLLEKGKAAADAVKTIKKASVPFVEEVMVADIFDLGGDLLALTLRSKLQDYNKTLSSQEIKVSEDLIVECLAKNGYALKM